MDEPELISTHVLADATHYIDQIVETVREAHSNGVPLDVETLTVMMLAGIQTSEIPQDIIISQQAVLLSVAIQRLAS